MVFKHENFMLAAFQVVSPGLEDFNNAQQLAVIGFIPSFCWNHLPGEKGYQIPLSRIIQGQLTENYTNSIARSIRLNLDMILRIKMI